MKLKMVTFTTDLTQFLVDAETNEEAINKAMKANRLVGVDTFEDGCTEENITTKENYVVENVNFNLLKGIATARDYYMFSTEDAIVYSN